MDEIKDYQEGRNDSDEDDEEVIKRIVQREKEILNSVGSEKILEKVNLNKLNNKEITVVKKLMDERFTKNQITIGHPDFKYDIEKDFNPEESNEWDKSQSKASFSKIDISQKQQIPVKPTIKEEKPVTHTKTQSKPTNMAGADEEFDIDFDEDFNDDLDDFDD